MPVSHTLDETRAGRQLLKDFVDGKLCYREWPPDSPAEIIRHTPYDDVVLEDDEVDQEGSDDHEAAEGDEGEEAQESGPSGAVGGIYVRLLVWDSPSIDLSRPALENSVSFLIPL